MPISLSGLVVLLGAKGTAAGDEAMAGQLLAGEANSLGGLYNKLTKKNEMRFQIARIQFQNSFVGHQNMFFSTVQVLVFEPYFILL